MQTQRPERGVQADSVGRGPPVAGVQQRQGRDRDLRQQILNKPAADGIRRPPPLLKCAVEPGGLAQSCVQPVGRSEQLGDCWIARPGGERRDDKVRVGADRSSHGLTLQLAQHGSRCPHRMPACPQAARCREVARPRESAPGRPRSPRRPAVEAEIRLYSRHTLRFAGEDPATRQERPEF